MKILFLLMALILYVSHSQNCAWFTTGGSCTITDDCNWCGDYGCFSTLPFHVCLLDLPLLIWAWKWVSATCFKTWPVSKRASSKYVAFTCPNKNTCMFTELDFNTYCHALAHFPYQCPTRNQLAHLQQTQIKYCIICSAKESAILLIIFTSEEDKVLIVTHCRILGIILKNVWMPNGWS